MVRLFFFFTLFFCPFLADGNLIGGSSAMVRFLQSSPEFVARGFSLRLGSFHIGRHGTGFAKDWFIQNRALLNFGEAGWEARAIFHTLDDPGGYVLDVTGSRLIDFSHFYAGREIRASLFREMSRRGVVPDAERVLFGFDASNSWSGFSGRDFLGLMKGRLQSDVFAQYQDLFPRAGLFWRQSTHRAEPELHLGLGGRRPSEPLEGFRLMEGQDGLVTTFESADFELGRVGWEVFSNRFQVSPSRRTVLEALDGGENGLRIWESKGGERLVPTANVEIGGGRLLVFSGDVEKRAGVCLVGLVADRGDQIRLLVGRRGFGSEISFRRYQLDSEVRKLFRSEGHTLLGIRFREGRVEIDYMMSYTAHPGELRTVLIDSEGGLLQRF